MTGPSEGAGLCDYVMISAAHDAIDALKSLTSTALTLYGHPPSTQQGRLSYALKKSRTSQLVVYYFLCAISVRLFLDLPRCFRDGKPTTIATVITVQC